MPIPDPNALARLKLALIPGLGPITQLRLVEHFGSAAAALAAGPALCAFAGPALEEAITLGPDAELYERTLRWIESPGRHLITYEDARYPSVLREIAAPPGVLYAIGDPALLALDSVAIVGARSATPQGARDARAMSIALCEARLCIVSGLALGIDAAAHRGALECGGASVAVMGTGADRIYPRDNKDIARQLAACGCIVTEFPLGMPPLPGNFPRRNRLISGLSLGVVVIEANAESGSLVTARYAVEQGREVMAMPGSVHSPLSKGCHKLIREGAVLVQCANDVLAELGRAAESPPAQGPACSHQSADPLLEAIGGAPANAEQIAMRTGLAAAAIAARLSLLQVEGKIEPLPGGRFQRVTGPA